MVPYRFGSTSFANFVWINGGALFDNEPPHWLMVNVEMGNAGTFALEVCAPNGAVVSSGQNINGRGGWNSFYLTPGEDLKMKPTVRAGQFKLRLVNRSAGVRHAIQGTVEWER